MASPVESEGHAVVERGYATSRLGSSRSTRGAKGAVIARPVTFHYKTDGTTTPQFGSIAKEVERPLGAFVWKNQEMPLLALGVAVCQSLNCVKFVRSLPRAQTAADGLRKPQ